MSSLPRLPPELILEIVEKHFIGRESLSVCGMASSLLWERCQRMLYTSTVIHLESLSLAHYERNGEFERITFINPTIASYVSSLTLHVSARGYDYVPEFLNLFTHVQHLTVSAASRLSVKLVDIIESIITLPTMSRVTFPHCKANYFPLRVLKGCARLRTVSLNVYYPFVDDSLSSDHQVTCPSEKIAAKIQTLVCVHPTVCHQVNSIIGLQSLGSLTTKIMPTLAGQISTAQALINNATFLIELQLAICDFTRTMTVSIMNLRNLQVLTFVTIGPIIIQDKTVHIICDILETLHPEHTVSEITIKLDWNTFNEDKDDGAVWKRLDRIWLGRLA